MMTRTFGILVTIVMFVFSCPAFLAGGMPPLFAVISAAVMAAIGYAVSRYLNGPWVSAWTTLDMIPAGSVFVTRGGTKAVRTKHYLSQNQPEMNECILLGSGESQYFQDDVTDVRIINV